MVVVVMVAVLGWVPAQSEAMTFPDRTCYPVASCNLKDFYNLIDVPWNPDFRWVQMGGI